MSKQRFLHRKHLMQFIECHEEMLGGLFLKVVLMLFTTRLLVLDGDELLFLKVVFNSVANNVKDRCCEVAAFYRKQQG